MAPTSSTWMTCALPAKGVHVLVDAMRHLRGGAIELHLHGPLEWFPEDLVDLRERAVGLPARFHGRYASGQVDTILADLDVVALPSLWPEKRPLVLS